MAELKNYQVTFHIRAEDNQAVDRIVDVMYDAVRGVQEAHLDGSDRKSVEKGLQ